MSDDWQVGDLAVCVDVGPNPYGLSAGERLELGRVYRVAGFGRSRWHAYSLMLEGARAKFHHDGFGFLVTRFRKIRPDAHEACEAEFITLLKRSKRKVEA